MEKCLHFCFICLPQIRCMICLRLLVSTVWQVKQNNYITLHLLCRKILIQIIFKCIFGPRFLCQRKEASWIYIHALRSLKERICLLWEWACKHARYRSKYNNGWTIIFWATFVVHREESIHYIWFDQYKFLGGVVITLLDWKPRDLSSKPHLAAKHSRWLWAPF